ncbi:Transthyretin-like family protein [Aphelenchoides besseyi]|nr:Transthyretin-like family protein [Aphelenchoides besseyi]
MRILFLFLPFVSAELLHSMYEIQAQSQLPKREGRLQGVSVRGRLICGSRPLVGVRVKIVDVDKRPDKDDLMGDVRTADDGEFHISGATREQTQIDVLMKIYHDCLDDAKVGCTCAFRPLRFSALSTQNRLSNSSSILQQWDVHGVVRHWNVELGDKFLWRRKRLSSLKDELFFFDLRE